MTIRRPAASIRLVLLACWLPTLGTGCLSVPRAKYDKVVDRLNDAREENDALLTKLDNAEAHAVDSNRRLGETEEQLARLAERFGLDRQRLGALQRERGLYQQFAGLRSDGEQSKLLREFAESAPYLRYDPQSGVAKLVSDPLFETGSVEISPRGEKLLNQIAYALKDPKYQTFRVFVCGHTDNKRIKGRELRQKYPTNFHLSSGRSLGVLDYLLEQGIESPRLAFAGFGRHQPIVTNSSDENRQLNRRVEIFVTTTDTGIIGWSDTVPSLYRQDRLAQRPR